MRVFVFTWDRYDSITTSAALERDGIDHTVLCHTDEHRDRFVDGGLVHPDRLHVTDQPMGLAYNRNAALDLMDEGEWAVFLVDDWMRCEQLQDYEQHAAAGEIPVTTANASEWGRQFKAPVTMSGFMDRCVEARDYADAYGAHLVGFAGYTNALFRRQHWKANVLADGRAWVVRKTHLRFDEHVQLIDDVCWTALNIRTFGIMFVNQWVLPLCRRYTAGAFGSIPERLDMKARECRYLVDTYPDLITFKAKPGWPAGTHVVLRRNPLTADRW